MKHVKDWVEMILSALFAVYMYVLFKIILFKFGAIDLPTIWQQLQRSAQNPNYIKNRLELANFIPFQSISDNLQRFSTHDVVNLFGNIVVFMPFGIFLVLLSKRISPLSVFMRAFGISLALECLQVILLIGSFDVDDLILNSSGGLLGYCVYRMIMKLTKPKKRMADPVLNVIL